jgi:hypothetical protein
MKGEVPGLQRLARRRRAGEAPPVRKAGTKPRFAPNIEAKLGLVPGAAGEEGWDQPKFTPYVGAKLGLV